ncbi:MAG: hypothetical protein H0V29_02025 [Thermoleophilaceae bacterium]|nr:hypothetical protein [Thermoleophilaceae bacterium]
MGLLAAPAMAQTTTQNPDGGTGMGEVTLYPEAGGPKAVLQPDGTAIPPAGAPAAVKKIIRAANRIAKKPYVYGGGHTANFRSRGYDCSGSMSFALRGAGLVKTPLNSTGFMSWGSTGPGNWVTTYAHGGRAYMVIAGLRFDTSGRSKKGTRWQADLRSTRGYKVRHPDGL